MPLEHLGYDATPQEVLLRLSISNAASKPWSPLWLTTVPGTRTWCVGVPVATVRIMRPRRVVIIPVFDRAFAVGVWE